MTGQCRTLAGLPLASNAPDVLSLQLDTEPPDFEGPTFEADARAWYLAQARQFLDALQKHAPGGFVDAVFGELALRKASLFRVTG